MNVSKNPRISAAEIIFAVIEHKKSLNEVLPQAEISNHSSLAKALSFGVCRYYFQLQWLLKSLLSKPIKSKEALVKILLLQGIFEILYMQTAHHAIVNETVNAAKALKKLWASQLINAVLRKVIRQKDYYRQQLKNDIVAEYAHPQWLIKRLQQAWPQSWQMLLQANNQPGPMALRVNLNQSRRESYQQRLIERSLISQAITNVPSALVLEKPCSIQDLPFFADGYCSVQDVNAQLAAYLLDLSAGDKVLDACAAPGGKATHILEAQPQLNYLLALDSDKERVKKITENFQRLQVQAEIKVSAAENLSNWWDKTLFDRILLDAPCSATGVIRRHPDIKLLRREADIAVLAQQQLKLLTALWQVLKEQGKLLYVTCSILPEENAMVIEKFLSSQHDAKLLPITDFHSHSQIGLQLFPGDNLGDGFYYCLLQKVP